MCYNIYKLSDLSVRKLELPPIFRSGNRTPDNLAIGKINSKSSSKFFKSLYKELLSGLNKRSALVDTLDVLQS